MPSSTLPTSQASNAGGWMDGGKARQLEINSDATMHDRQGGNRHDQPTNQPVKRPTTARPTARPTTRMSGSQLKVPMNTKVSQRKIQTTTTTSTTLARITISCRSFAVAGRLLHSWLCRIAPMKRWMAADDGIEKLYAKLHFNRACRRRVGWKALLNPVLDGMAF